MKQSLPILAGLAAALIIGLLLAGTTDPTVTAGLWAFETLGRIWVAFLKMTVIPLVMSLLITSIVSASERLGQIAGKALLVFVLLYLFAGAMAALVAPFVLSWLVVTPDTVATLTSLVGGSARPSVETIPFADQLVRLVPENPFAAASNAEILPLVIFSLLFGLAVTRLPIATREAVNNFFLGVRDAMLTIVRWILVIAPLGVFAVVLPLATQMGSGLVGALAFYVLMVVGLTIVLTIPLYAIARVAGGVSLSRFARGCASPQSVAAGTQSSLASLPAMIEAADTKLELSPNVTGVVLPLAVSLFRYSGPIWMVTVATFTAHLYGIEFSTAQMVGLVLLGGVITIGGVGLPSGAGFFGQITPLFMGMGLPLEITPLFFAVDTLPDLVQTVSNVTGDVTAAAIVDNHADIN
ncbi:MAG: cation:dicarboxylase symporter family transporter [Acidobacteriota bacterium]